MYFIHNEFQVFYYLYLLLLQYTIIYYILKIIIPTVFAWDAYLYIIPMNFLEIHICWCLLLSNFIIYLIFLLFICKGIT